MVSQSRISITLDTRRKNKRGKFPVRLRVYSGFIGKQKLYPLNLECTETEFKKIWHTKNPKGIFETYQLELSEILTKAKEIARSMQSFSFDEFQKRMFNSNDKEKTKITYWYNIVIQNHKENGQISTANTYELSLKSLIGYAAGDISFNCINAQWLNRYEKYMINNQKTLTTIGIYLRNLRAIFNNAIKEGVIDKEIYPFGKKMYNIPNPKGVKKALSKEDLKLLWESTPTIESQKKAKAFWFFSYLCNGMNIRDIVFLRHKDIENSTFSFIRQKTKNTNKDQEPIIVVLNDYTRQVIKEYGTSSNNKSDYIFPIINKEDSPEDAFRKSKNFVRVINKNMNKICKEIGITSKVNTYGARHSFATTTIRNGGAMEYVSEALGHSSLKTTQTYFAGFASNYKKSMSDKLLKFD